LAYSSPSASRIASPPAASVSSPHSAVTIAAHPEMAVNQPDRHGDVRPAQSPKPGQRMVIVGVDERSIDIEDGDRHPHDLPRAATISHASVSRARMGS